MRLFVLFPGLREGGFRDARPSGRLVGVDQFPTPVLGLPHLALRVVLDRLDLVALLRRRGLGMAAQAGLPDRMDGPDDGVGRVAPPRFGLDLRHVALVALDAGPVVGAAPVGLGLRMLQFDQSCARHGVPEVVEVHLPVVGQDVLRVLHRVVVRAAVLVAHLLPRAELEPGVAGVFYVALGAHHPGVGLAQDADLPEAPEIDHLHVRLPVPGEGLRSFPVDRLDEGVPDDPGGGAVAVMAVDAAHGILCRF